MRYEILFILSMIFVLENMVILLHALSDTVKTSLHLKLIWTNMKLWESLIVKEVNVKFILHVS